MSFHYFALFGNTPSLSLTELEIVLTRHDWGEVLPFTDANCVPFTLKKPELVDSLIPLLGGTVKILTAFPPSPKLIEAQIIESIKNLQAPTVALSCTDPKFNLAGLASLIKTEIKRDIPQFRYRLLKSPLECAGIGTTYLEIMLRPNGTGYALFHTVAIQDIERWGDKDYGRPESNPKSGMLPPKIARMMVNCAFSKPLTVADVVLDPFCGMGTILAESLDLGASVIATDISAKAVVSCALNLNWFRTKYGTPGTIKTQVCDVHSLSLGKIKTPVAAVVFEGYLGPAKMNDYEVKNVFKGLEKLYIGALKNLLTLVKPGGRLVIALPNFMHRGHVKTMDALVDSCEKYGYTQVTSPMVYGRPSAKVRRSVYVLQKPN